MVRSMILNLPSIHNPLITYIIHRKQYFVTLIYNHLGILWSAWCRLTGTKYTARFPARCTTNSEGESPRITVKVFCNKHRWG